MIYYSNRNISWVFLLLVVCVLIICVFKATEYIKIEETEHLIGYEIDEMKSVSDSSIYYDTVAVFYKKGDMFFIKGTGSYTFKKER